VISQDSKLVKIVKLAVKLLKNLQLPKRVGRPFVYQPVVIVCCLLVMVAKRLSVRGLYTFLTEPDGYSIRLVIPFPQGNIPNRRTFDRRFKQSLYALQLAMVTVTLFVVKRFHLGIARLSLDNRMFQAVGAIWHRKDQLKGIIPNGLRNIDKTAGWGVSHYRGWVYGHGLDVFVTTGKVVFPVIALARSLVVRGNTAVKQLITLLPTVQKGVIVADSEYCDQKLDHLLQATGRRLYAPSKYYPKQLPKSRTYQRRKTTVEPFYERFLLAFCLRGKLDRKGPHAWPYLVACCLLYQLMVTTNLLNGNAHPLEVTHFIRML
jgi:hypothetical protein